MKCKKLSKGSLIEAAVGTEATDSAVEDAPEPDANPASPEEASLDILEQAEQALQIIPAVGPAATAAPPERKPGLEEQMKELLWASNKVLLRADESQSIVEKTRKTSEDLGEKLYTMEEEACDLTLQSTATAGRRASVRSGDDLRSANEEALKKAFTQFDKNGDGFLSEQELLAVLTRPTPERKPMTLAAASRVFRELDQNGDGQIDYTEFVQNWSRVVAKRVAEAASKESAQAAQSRRISTAVPSYHSVGGRLFDA